MLARPSKHRHTVLKLKILFILQAVSKENQTAGFTKLSHLAGKAF
jgi:hypothetical protein